MKITALSVLLLITGSASASSAFISTTTNALVGSLSITNGDIVRLNPVQVDVYGLDLFGPTDGFVGSNKNIDALARYGDSWIYSTSTDSTIDGITFKDGDLVSLDASLNKTLFMPESVFVGDEDIDALEILPNGNILLSTDSRATLGGLTFESGDVVSYDRNANTATLFFRGADFFTTTQNIDALAILPDNSMLFSTVDDASNGSFIFRDGDIIRYDFTGASGFSVYLTEDIFLENEDIDALAVADVPLPLPIPIPGTVWLFGSALAALFFQHRRVK